MVDDMFKFSGFLPSKLYAIIVNLKSKVLSKVPEFYLFTFTSAIRLVWENELHMLKFDI